jgi:hypothetical protein
MNAAVSSFRFRWVYLLLVALVAGCAGPRINWESRVGSYTYDNAVMELGPPDKQAALQDGSIVAEWLTHPGRTYISPAFGYGGYPYWYGPFHTTYTETQSPDHYLRLVFGPDQRLTSWKRFSR